MRSEEIYLIHNSMQLLLELGNYLLNRNDAFEVLSNLVIQFEKSITDPTTSTHSARVAVLAELMANLINLSENETTIIKQAAFLHDIGKIALPVKIFIKQNRLNSAEWQMVRLHPELGAFLIKTIPHLNPLLPGILYHHERYNGGGYPYGLKQDQIPLMGRIIGLVDAFEALTAKRTYHIPLTAKQALQKMERQKKEGLWDPYLFEILTELVTSPEYFLEKNIEEIDLIKN